MTMSALSSSLLRFHRLASVASLALVLVACGGGGGSDGGGDNAGGGGGSGGGPTVPAWQVAELLEATDEKAEGADVAINADGVGYAVWMQVDNNRQKIMSSRYVDGRWELAREITRNLDQNQNAKDPQVVVHPDGRATAIWVQPHLGLTAVVGSNTAADGSWLPMKVMQSMFAPASPPADLELVADHQGNALAVWCVEATVYASAIRGAEFETPPSEISVRADRGAASPDVAMNANGEALVVWSERDNNNVPRIFGRSYVKDAWTPTAYPLSSDFDTVSNAPPRVAIGQDFKPVVTWLQAQNAVKNVVARVALDVAANDWGDLTILGNGQAFLPAVAMNAQGRAVVAWLERDGTRLDARAAHYDGSGWAVEEPVEEMDAGEANFVKVGMDASGRATAVWQQSDGTRVNIYANQMDPASGVWGVPVLIENEDRGAAGTAALAVNAGGQVVAAWNQANGVVTPPLNTPVLSIMANVFK
jgi:hypothetical protein